MYLFCLLLLLVCALVVVLVALCSILSMSIGLNIIMNFLRIMKMKTQMKTQKKTKQINVSVKNYVYDSFLAHYPNCLSRFVRNALHMAIRDRDFFQLVFFNQDLSD